jgi:hypothetical protein
MFIREMGSMGSMGSSSTSALVPVGSLQPVNKDRNRDYTNPGLPPTQPPVLGQAPGIGQQVQLGILEASMELSQVNLMLGQANKCGNMTRPLRLNQAPASL